MGHSLAYSIATTAESATSITKRLIIDYVSTGAVVDSVNAFNVTGDFPNYSSAVSINVPSGGGNQQIYNSSIVVAKAYGSTPTKSFAASLSGINYWGTTVSTSGSTVIPARAYTAPTTPGNPTISNRTSTGFRASWLGTSDWGGNTGTYKVRISSNSFASYTEYSVAAGTTLYDFTGLANNTAYQVRVYANNVAGDSPSYGSASTSTLVAVPSTGIQPTVSGITATGATVAWADPSNWGGEDTSTFDVQYANNSGMSGALTVAAVGNSKAISGLGNNTPMWTRVAARNSAGLGPYSATRPFTTLVALPSQAGQPSVSGVDNDSAVATWGDPGSWGGEDTSQFYARLNAASATLVTGNTRTWTGLTGNTTYSVDEAAKNSAGTGAYSASRSFLTKPSLATGLSATDLSPTSARVLCSAPAGGAATYRLQVATDAGFTAVVYDVTNTSRDRTLTGLNPATTYHYRWLAGNATGDIGWTAAATFTTLAGSYVWHGGVWKNATAYVWSGSVWKVAQPHLWRSGAWRQ